MATLQELEAERNRLQTEEAELKREYGSARGGKDFLTGKALEDWERRSLANDKALSRVNYEIAQQTGQVAPPGQTPPSPFNFNPVTNDDSSAQKPTSTAPDASSSSTPTQNATNVAAATQSNTSSANSDGVMPGRRPYNPLSKLSSYTYNLALYMVTPEAYSLFVLNGQANPQDFIIVAQSGGINQAQANNRAFDRDMYIDELTFKTLTNTKETGASTVDSINFEFKIFEPYGFSFLNGLKQAALKNIAKSKIINQAEATHHMQQYYMLGIKFYGYDQDGNVVDNSNFNELGTGDQSEPTALFPRYFPIYLTSMQFKLDGKVTTYTIKAVPVSMQIGFGAKRGLLGNGGEIRGETVEEILIGNTKGSLGLEQWMNHTETHLKDQKSILFPNKYKIEFTPKAEVIKKSLMVTDQEQNKQKAPMGSDPEKTKDVNDKNAAKAVYNPTKRTLSVPAGQSVSQIIEAVLGMSNYVESALKILHKENKQLETPEDKGPDSPGSEIKIAEEGKQRFLDWFVITPICKPIAYDTQVNDYAYEITYKIDVHEVSFVRSPYVGQIEGYSGPHKRYEYIYTGQNNEILNYEQSFNNLYYMQSVEETGPNTNPPVPQKVNQKVNAYSVKNDKAGLSTASIRNSLFSPGDQAKAKISILGDPDFIITTPGMNYSIYKKFYGPDYSVDAHGGQVFIEIDFKEAVDYNNETGLMDMNEKFSIYEYPEFIKNKIKGISYMVQSVTSTFSRGRFTQDLDLTIWSPPADVLPKSQAASSTATPVVTDTSSYTGPSRPSSSSSIGYVSNSNQANDDA